MKKIRCYSLLAVLCWPVSCWADSTLEYLVNTGRTQSDKTQSVLVKDGSVLIKAAGGNSQLDLLYKLSPEKLLVIDHKKRSIMAVNEQQIASWAKTAEAAQPLLQGFAKQVARMDPQQRAKWQQMLGGSVSLDKIGEAAKPSKAATLVDSGQTNVFAGVNCNLFGVLVDNVPSAELCLAGKNSLKLGAGDYSALISLLNFSNRLIETAHGLGGQFGVNMPSVSLRDIAGIPIEIRDLAKNANGGIVLKRISNTGISEALMQTPQGYTAEPLALFK